MKLFKQYKEHDHTFADKIHLIKHQYRIYEKINYKTHQLSVLEAFVHKTRHKDKSQEEKRFVFITNIVADVKNIHQLIKIGRLHWKIENEGFNNQKNNDYALSHKFSRTSFNAAKNYYQLLQIADIISQLSFKLQKTQELIKNLGFTIKSLIHKIISYLIMPDLLMVETANELLSKKQQLRY